MSAGLFLVLVLASYRLTRLLVLDKILDVPRYWVTSRTSIQAGSYIVPARGWRGYAYKLITCFWCTGFWAAGTVVGMAYLYRAFDYALAIWFAVAALAPLTRLLEELVEAARDALDRMNT